MTSEDVIAALTKGVLRGVISLFDSDELAEVITLTQNDTGWVLPLEGSNKCYWFVRRATRHALFCLCITYAHKFKYKQINLNQRFEHYMALVDKEDADWKDADIPADTSAERIAQFGHVAGAGFAYGPAGEDLTYTNTTTVRILPEEEE